MNYMFDHRNQHLKIKTQLISFDIEIYYQFHILKSLRKLFFVNLFIHYKLQTYNLIF